MKLLVLQRLLSLEMDTTTRVQILDETICIIYIANIIAKGMNLIIHLQAMGK